MQKSLPSQGKQKKMRQQRGTQPGRPFLPVYAIKRASVPSVEQVPDRNREATHFSKARAKGRRTTAVTEFPKTTRNNGLTPALKTPFRNTMYTPYVTCTKKFPEMMKSSSMNPPPPFLPNTSSGASATKPHLKPPVL